MQHTKTKITTDRLEAGVITEVDDYKLPLSKWNPSASKCQQSMSSMEPATINKMYRITETLSLSLSVPKRSARHHPYPQRTPTYRYGKKIGKGWAIGSAEIV